MKLRRKILILLILLALLPILVFLVFNMNIQNQKLDEQVQQAGQTALGQTVLQMNHNLGNLDYLMTEMYMPQEGNLAPVDYLKKYVHGDSSEMNPNSDLASMLRMIGRNAQLFAGYVNEIIIFAPDGTHLDAGMDDSLWISGSYHPEGETWFQNALSAGGGTWLDGPSVKAWMHADEESVAFCSALYSVNEREFTGVIVIDCDLSFLTDAFANAWPGILAFQVEAEGDDHTASAVSGNQPTGLQMTGNSANVLADNASALDDDFRKADCVDFAEDLDYFHLRLRTSVDRHLMRRQMGYEYTRFLILAVICIASTLILSVVISGIVSGPVTQLSRRIRGTDGSDSRDVTDLPAFEREDEIGTLYNAYQHMLEEQRDYEKNELQNRLILLDARMQALESQINAHFLYNTLESINSIASIYHVDDISRMATALGRMFRYSIRTESELVPLSDELQHVSDYMTIQMIRFDHSFDYEVKMSETMRKEKVLKLMLQPVVENAVLHGFSGMKSEGKIIVESRYEHAPGELPAEPAAESDDGYGHTPGELPAESTAENDDETGAFLRITVSDNGRGMNSRTLDKLRNSLNGRESFVSLGHRENHGGIGLKNLNTRLQLYYGKKYYMEIESDPGWGTRVIMHIPRQRREDGI